MSRVTAFWHRLPALVQDLACGVVVVAGWIAGTSAVERGLWGSDGLPNWVSSAHAVAMWATALAVALRRTAPPWLLLVGVGVYAVVLPGPLLTEFHLLPVLVVAYTVAQSGTINPILVGAVCMGVTAFLFEVLPGDDRGIRSFRPAVRGAPDVPANPYRAGSGFDWSRILFSLFVVAGTTFLGALVHAQRRSAAALRSAESQQVVMEERTRIARELHDVVAHHVSAIVIRAQAAERLAPKQPEVASDAVSWIADAGKEALNGMRHAVHALRRPEADGEVELAPQPTLGDLRGIVERLAPAGLDVDVRLPETLPTLDPQVHLAAVRIAQEALTNALRHTQARRAVVDVWAERSELQVTVDDDGGDAYRPPPRDLASVEGHGLRGMVERAAACGGSLAIGRSALGGWSVQARLPQAGAS